MTDSEERSPEKAVLRALVKAAEEYQRAQEAYLAGQIEVNKLPSDRVDWGQFSLLCLACNVAAEALDMALKKARECL